MMKIAVMVAAAACSAGGGDPDGPDGSDQLFGPVPGMETNGPALLGDNMDGLGREPGFHLSVTTEAVDARGKSRRVVFAGGASLETGSHRGVDPVFEGMVLRGPEGGSLRLTPVSGGTDIARYNLEAQAPEGGEWFDPCRGGDAVPLAGVWTHSGLHQRDPSRITFACASSAAYKCLLWGYVPGTDDTSLLWRSHQACTRMVRVDYCGDGTPHTREGTKIGIFDYAGVSKRPAPPFEGVQSWPPAVGRYFFEAAWNDGDQPASCLSRLRWQSLPIGGTCPSRARDPRADTTARYCEDLEWPDPGSEPTGALLFSESRYTDLAFHVWANGTDLVGTVRGYNEGPGLPVREPFPNLGAYTHVDRDSLLVRSMREGVDPSDFEELRVYRRPGDVVIAGVSQPPPGFPVVPGEEGFEGLARKTNPGGLAVPLKMFKHATTGDYLSMTGEPPVGYEYQWTIGFTLPSE